MIQDTMVLLRGLKHSKTMEMLTELERTSHLKQEKDEKYKIFKWGATRPGVDFWVGSTKAIPASIAKVAFTLQRAEEFEGN